MARPRRETLKGAAAVAALGSLPRRASAQKSTMHARTKIDPVLTQAVDAREVPGVVAMAATDKGVLYEGAFGPRALEAGSASISLDTVFRIASMTKAIATVAAMQLVEQGKLELEEPVPAIDPALGSPQILEGFDAAGAPKLRPAKRPITLRHLLTHTAGFTYDIWSPDTVRYVKATGLPNRATGKVASLRTPLAFDPGDRWLYGINIEWTGRLIETVSGQGLDDYFRDRIFGPLGMKDSTYVTTNEQRARQARLHTRGADGALTVQPLEPVPVNTYYWLDPAKRVTGLIMTQIRPFADQRAVKLYGQLERGVYDPLNA
jgi:methyl acetate hydrolase